VQLNHLAAAGAVLATEIAPRSPAEAAGLRMRDIIIGFCGAVIGGIDDLQRLLTTERIDRTTSITVLRDGVQLMLPIIPTENPDRRQAH
jgi:S1-C subfamily serine protease